MPLSAAVKVASLPELIDCVTPGFPEPASGRRRGYFVYRGAADSGASLLTTLDRLGGIDPPRSRRHLEAHIFRNFIGYATPYVRPEQGDWELLFTAQHHGLPTRLLDWTHSPLVAAHFATLGESAQGDRVVWQLDWRRVHERFGLRPLAFSIADLEAALADRGIDSLADFFARGDSVVDPFACMIEPPASESRVAAQSAAFTLCTDGSQALDAFLDAHGIPDALRRIVIPGDAVPLVRDQLDLCAIDERRLFPDLDGVAREVARYYSESGTDLAPLRPPASGE